MHDAYRDFADGKRLDLVRSGINVKGRHETLPDTLNELCIRKGTFFLLILNERNDLYNVSDIRGRSRAASIPRQEDHLVRIAVLAHRQGHL